MTSIALLLCVLGVASALPQFINPATPTQIRRTEQYDEFGQYSRSYDLSDQQSVHETGYLKANRENDGLVLIKMGFYQHPTPEGKVVRVEYLADETGFHILSSNVMPVAPSPVAATF